MATLGGASHWVVYMSVQGKQMGAKSVCTQAEWDALEAAQPGANQLIQADLSESAAEKLARGSAGDPKKRPIGASRKISRFQNDPIEAEAA
jgi:hypothetical protein